MTEGPRAALGVETVGVGGGASHSRMGGALCGGGACSWRGGAMEGKAGTGLGWAGPRLWRGAVERELGLGQEGSMGPIKEG